MIIHHSENLKKYSLCIQKPLKYSDKFTFVPLRLQKDNNYLKCIFQTPLLFTPYGIQQTPNNKSIIDISFQNMENDKSQKVFYKNLKHIYDCVYHKYKYDYIVNDFLKNTDFNECLRLKLTSNTLLYNESKAPIEKIDKYTYGTFIIELEGVWLNDDNIWFQWNLLQGKIKTPTYLSEYSFIDENKDENKDKRLPNKYDKMLKMGVPREAVDRQKRLDGYNIPPPPPFPPFPPLPPFPPMHPGAPPNNNTNDIPKINASDLRNVVLKKGKHIPKKKIKNNNNFEPPTKEELQTTLSRLRPTK
jgi:hypothetical protein